MKVMYFLAISLLLWMSCTAQPPNETRTPSIDKAVAEVRMASYDDVLLGAERMDELLPMLKGQRVALVVNPTAVINEVHLLDTLLREGIDIQTVFAPEHGFRGGADAGAHIKDEVDTKTGIFIRSLYGKNKRPKQAWLEDLDIVVFDIQDVGARFYTYLTTMHYMMEACAEAGVTFVVLDRPNPHGFYVDGPVLDSAFQSFVGWLPVPMVHGMTLGEMALMIQGEGWMATDSVLDLEVLEMEGYDHQSTYDLPIAPSPNLPNHQAVMLYPSLCLYEGTIFSIGRGTPTPFQVLGHPDLDEGDFTFTPRPTLGAFSPKLEGRLCRGYDYSEEDLTSRMNQRGLFLDLWTPLLENRTAIDRPRFFDLLMGTDEVRKQLEEGIPLDEIRAGWEEDVRAFKAKRELYLLYP